MHLIHDLCGELLIIKRKYEIKQIIFFLVKQIELNFFPSNCCIVMESLIKVFPHWQQCSSKTTCKKIQPLRTHDI